MTDHARTRDRSTLVRWTRLELDAVTGAAENAGVPREEWMRAALLEAAHAPRTVQCDECGDDAYALDPCSDASCDACGRYLCGECAHGAYDPA